MGKWRLDPVLLLMFRFHWLLVMKMTLAVLKLQYRHDATVLLQLQHWRLRQEELDFEAA